MIRKDRLYLLIGLLIYVGVYIAFYPPIYGIKDEAGYLGMAQVLKQGTVFSDITGQYLVGSEKQGQHITSKWPVGNPILILPFLLIHWKAVFLMPFLLHIFAFFIFFLILREIQIEPVFSLLYLFYPALFLYSRTIMADLPSAVVFITAFYFYIKKGRYLYPAGLLFGFSILIRYANFLFFLPFVFFAIADFLYKRKDNSNKYNVFRLFAGFLPALFLLLFYNRIVFGGFFIFPVRDISYFSLDVFVDNLGWYLLSFFLIYPGMLLSIFFYKRKGYRESIAFIVIFTLFYSFYSYILFPSNSNLVGRFVVGLRFLLPVIPLFLLFYSSILERFKKMKGAFLIYNFFIGILIIFDIAMVNSHQHFLYRQKRMKDFIYNKTAQNSILILDNQGAELIQPFWGERECIHISEWVLKKEELATRKEKLYLIIQEDYDKGDRSNNIKRIMHFYSDTLLGKTSDIPQLCIFRLNPGGDGG